MTKKILVASVGLIALIAVGFYVWRMWGQNEAMYHADYPNYISRYFG